MKTYLVLWIMITLSVKVRTQEEINKKFLSTMSKRIAETIEAAKRSLPNKRLEGEAEANMEQDIKRLVVDMRNIALKVDKDMRTFSGNRKSVKKALQAMEKRALQVGEVASKRCVFCNPMGKKSRANQEPIQNVATLGLNALRSGANAILDGLKVASGDVASTATRVFQDVVTSVNRFVQNARSWIGV